jgi:Protein of unknown function (DUF1488)
LALLEVATSSAPADHGAACFLEARAERTMPLTFFPNAPAAPTDGGVNFTAHDSGKFVRCRVSCEALEDHCGLKSDQRADARKAFDYNLTRIQQVAARKYSAGQLEPDGSVLVRTSDM